MKELLKKIGQLDLVELIKSNEFATIAAIVVIVPQTVHTFKAFMYSEQSEHVTTGLVEAFSAIIFFYRARLSCNIFHPA